MSVAHRFWKRFSLAAGMAALLAAALCPFSTAALAAQSGGPEIVVGTEGTYPPFEFYSGENTLTGFDVEMVTLVGKKLGRKVTFADMSFDGLIPALVTSKIDMIAAAMNATDERRKQVGFSDVYQVSDASLVVTKDNDAFKSMDDLKGKTVGVQLGTTEDIFLSSADLGVEVKRYQKTNDAMEEVVLGRIDAVLFDTPVAAGFLKGDRFKDKAKVAFKELVNGPDEGFSLAFRKDDAELGDAVNGALRELEKSGELDKLRQKYGL
jgi:polar amino acid transport system substrate-binding protein